MPNLLTIFLADWWIKLCLLLAILSWTRATTFLTFFLSGEPLVCLDNFLWAFARAFWSVLKKRGFSILSWVENVAKFSKPTSIPTALSFFGKGLFWCSTEKQAYHLPFCLLMEQVLIVPESCLWSLILTVPILERLRISLTSLKPDWGKVKLS